MPLGPVRVFVAYSLDGFIAGPDGDLSWPPAGGGEDYGYRALLAQTSAILMGRRTYETAAGFDSWPYGEMPVFVATSRPLEPAPSTVRAISSSPTELLAAIGEQTCGGVYLDGGTLIRAFLDHDLIDQLTVTVVGVILGTGTPLFAGVRRTHRLRLESVTPYPNGPVQLRYTSPHPPCPRVGVSSRR